MDPVNILLVDDQPAKLLSYEVILQELGENLIKARSGREALEKLLQNDVAVILVDVCMPEQDGFELVAMIREHPRFQKTAIIFVSAVMMAEPDRLRGYEAGAVDYISVPIVPEVLRAKVRVFVELHRKTRELERLNAQLERRVRERTAELEASSVKLVALNEQLEQRIEERTREREEALAQLFEAQKLDTIGQLTGGVAHDFNNLLMAALGSLNLLKKRMAPDDRNMLLLDNAIQAAQRGSALTQRLLAFARRQELKLEAVDIAQLIDDIKELVQRAVGPGVNLESEVAPDLPPVLADANQLELALLNLYVNARDAMPSGGKVRVTISEHEAGEDDGPAGLRPGRYVRLVISDTGTGMDKDTLTRATEPFFTTKGVGKGTGLGLSMVQGLAAQSGGLFALKSAVGEGTQATLWLPVAPDGDARKPVPSGARSGPSTHASALRILVVDDDVLVAMGTVAMLEDLGHEPVEVHSGAAALDALASGGHFDVVITDHAMPLMSGLELAERIKEKYSTLPIILASGYVDIPEAGKHSLNLLRLTKPFSQEQLQQALSHTRDMVASVA
jgi:signal transduction histidine kinase